MQDRFKSQSMEDARNLRGWLGVGQLPVAWSLGVLSLERMPCSWEGLRPQWGRWLCSSQTPEHSSCSETGRQVTEARTLLWWTVQHLGAPDR